MSVLIVGGKYVVSPYCDLSQGIQRYWFPFSWSLSFFGTCMTKCQANLSLRHLSTLLLDLRCMQRNFPPSSRRIPLGISAASHRILKVQISCSSEHVLGCDRLRRARHLFRATKARMSAQGQTMSTLVVQERHLWLNRTVNLPTVAPARGNCSAYEPPPHGTVKQIVPLVSLSRQRVQQSPTLWPRCHPDFIGRT